MPKITGIRKCEPVQDTTRMQTVCRKPTADELDRIRQDLNDEMLQRGIDCSVFELTGTSINLSDCRLTREYIDKYGYNQSPHTGRRGGILGWQDWVEFNDALNDVMDRHGMSGNASSLGGKFKIRSGDQRFTEKDWRDLEQENVGSYMQPVAREDAWDSEGRGRQGWRDDTLEGCLVKARKLIEDDDVIVHEVAEQHNQILDNVKDTTWFKNQVAERLKKDRDCS